MKNNPPIPPATYMMNGEEPSPEATKGSSEGIVSAVTGIISLVNALIIAQMTVDAPSSSLMTFLANHEGPYDDVEGWGLLIGWPIMLMFDVVFMGLVVVSAVFGVIALVAGILGLRSGNGSHGRAPFIAGLVMGSVSIVLSVCMAVIFFTSIFM
jgi:hypothetical protein